jgi:2-oxoglutarate dehydrogenase E2 component (dihydrolipoamide succinyltransferase)
MKEVKVPELAESVTEGTIAQWLKKEGDPVEVGEALVELETDKINVEISSEYNGVLNKIMKREDDTVEVGDIIGEVDENPSTKEASKDGSHDVNNESHKTSKKDIDDVSENTSLSNRSEENQNNENAESKQSKTKYPVASPAARKKARELGIRLDEITSKDPLGRIRTEDVEKVAEQKKTLDTKQKKTNTENDKPIERVKMSRRRQTIANRLVEAQQTAAMLTTFNEVDMTAVMDVRKRRKDNFYNKHGVKLGFMSFFAKAVVSALKEFPLINAEIKDDEILIKKYYDIGIAVSAKEGLVVPVIRDVNKLSFAEIEKEVMDLSSKARDNKLKLDELQGGTFTITNGGVFGSLYSTPILNTPQVGILGMHTIQRRPVVVDNEDNVEVRPMMYVALSYDHRIIDGAEAVQFLVKVKELLEDPENLLLEG